MHKALINPNIQSNTPNTRDNKLLKLIVTEYARLAETEGF
jgi:hypothetical protein